MNKSQYDKWLEDEDKRKVENAHVRWHPTQLCTKCGGKMFWSDGFGRWICQSWLYMEGGCYWGDE